MVFGVFQIFPVGFSLWFSIDPSRDFECVSLAVRGDNVRLGIGVWVAEEVATSGRDDPVQQDGRTASFQRPLGPWFLQRDQGCTQGLGGFEKEKRFNCFFKLKKRAYACFRHFLLRRACK